MDQLTDASHRPKPASSNIHLTSGRLLARNVTWNLMGGLAPMLAAIFSIPLLARGLGTDRFGVLTLAWVLTGYFSLFDLGLARALTKLVAEKLGAGKENEIPALVSTSLFAVMILGFIGTILVLLLSPWLVNNLLKIPRAMQRETLYSFFLLGFSIPMVISTAGLRGFLEAKQLFSIVNAIRIPMGVFTFAGPLLVLPFSKSLLPAVTVLVAGRVIAWLVHLLFCLHVMPALRLVIAPSPVILGPLMRFGSWMTLTNIVGPLMVYMDRFVIGALISVSAVAYYATPSEVVTKLWIIPAAIVGVLFPAFSTSFVQDRSRTVLLFGRGVKCVFLALFPVTLIIVTFAREGLELWLGTEFSQNSTRVLQWLGVGVFMNSLAQIPFALVQGTGRPDITAKLHLIELPLYLLSVWWLTRLYGIAGSAIAWVVRVAVDMVFLFAVSYRIVPSTYRVISQTAFLVGIALPTLAIALLPTSIAMKSLFLCAALLAFALAAWFRILTPQERAIVEDRLKPFQVVQ